MSEFSVQSDGVDVVRIMDQIRARIREKRGEDYTEEQIRELANVKLERFLDPDKVRSELVEQYRRQRQAQQAAGAADSAPAVRPSFDFDPDTIYVSSRGLPGRLLYRIRKLLSPLLKFFFNVGPIVHALHVQREINAQQAEFINQVAKLFDLGSSRLTAREEIDALNYEVMNNLVVEMTRLAIEMKNHRMLVESVAGRLDFHERRARALEGVVQYREGSRAPAGARDGDSQDGTEPRRRRRRRGRRRSAQAAATDAEGAAAPAAESAGGTPPATHEKTQGAGEPPAPAQPSGETDPSGQ